MFHWHLISVGGLPIGCRFIALRAACVLVAVHSLCFIRCARAIGSFAALRLLVHRCAQGD